jgi:hypothetical protein
MTGFMSVVVDSLMVVPFSRWFLVCRDKLWSGGSNAHLPGEITAIKIGHLDTLLGENAGRCVATLSHATGNDDFPSSEFIDVLAKLIEGHQP